MFKTTLKIDGMMCGMCEAHVNDAIRAALPVKKVSSSHGKGETVIISESQLDEAVLTEAITKQGYKLLSVTCAPYEKKGLFSFFKK